MDTYQVIVIGGGIAGLSCIEKLLENRITNILLIEANDRLGENSFLEIGAQWIHGTEDNPIYDINRAIRNIKDSDKSADEMHYATQDGKVIDEDFVEKIIDEIHEEIDELENKIEKLHNTEIGLGELLEEILEKVIDEHGTDDDIELIKAIFKSEINNERHETSCDNLNELSAVGWNNYEKFEGNQFTTLKNGYIKLVEHLSSKIPDKLIKLNEVVEKIEWSGNIVKLTTLNSFKNQRTVYESKKVLCTIPLGYLKRKHQSLFYPSLPSEKVEAIERLGFGCVDKLFIVFDKPIFEKKFQGFQIFWRNDLEILLEANQKWNLSNTKFCKEFTTFELLPNHENTLFTFVAVEGANYLEGLEDDCLNDVIYEILTKSYPHFNIPRPKQIIRSKWHNQQFTFGSYSFVKTGSNPEHMDILAEPLNNLVYFAGEATESKYAGTVHGAFISGQKAAALITKSKNNSNDSPNSSESSEDD